MADVKLPIVYRDGGLSQLPSGDSISNAPLGSGIAGSGLVGGGDLNGGDVRFDVALASNPSGIIFVGDGVLTAESVGYDGVALTKSTTALASGFLDVSNSVQALQSGVLAQEISQQALASGNAALTNIDEFFPTPKATFIAAEDISAGQPVGLNNQNKIQKTESLIDLQNIRLENDTYQNITSTMRETLIVPLGFDHYLVWNSRNASTLYYTIWKRLANGTLEMVRNSSVGSQAAANMSVYVKDNSTGSPAGAVGTVQGCLVFDKTADGEPYILPWSVDTTTNYQVRYTAPTNISTVNSQAQRATTAFSPVDNAQIWCFRSSNSNTNTQYMAFRFNFATTTTGSPTLTETISLRTLPMANTSQRPYSCRTTSTGFSNPSNTNIKDSRFYFAYTQNGTSLYISLYDINQNNTLAWRETYGPPVTTNTTTTKKIACTTVKSPIAPASGTPDIGAFSATDTSSSGVFITMASHGSGVAPYQAVQQIYYFPDMPSGVNTLAQSNIANAISSNMIYNPNTRPEDAGHCVVLSLGNQKTNTYGASFTKKIYLQDNGPATGLPSGVLSPSILVSGISNFVDQPNEDGYASPVCYSPNPSGAQVSGQVIPGISGQGVVALSYNLYAGTGNGVKIIIPNVKVSPLIDGNSNVIGAAATDALKDETVEVDLPGSINTAVSGLVPGRAYYPTGSGSWTTESVQPQVFGTLFEGSQWSPMARALTPSGLLITKTI